MARKFNIQLQNLHVLLSLFGFLLLMRPSNAREFVVGGSTWTVPSNTSLANYIQWAGKNRFQIGDSIVFNYQPGQDSVLQVTREDYENCTTTSPISKNSDGHTVVTFHQSGPHYFISGIKENCLNNQKLIVIVLADRSNKHSPPSPAPTTETVAPPPQHETEDHSPPPSETAESNPNPAPAADGPPKNAATSIYLGSIGAAFVCSSFIYSIMI